MKMGELYQSADWKNEKHAPAIELPDSVKKGEPVEGKVSIGKEIGHPNKTEHHIEWFEVYFKPEGGKFPYLIGRFEFTAHGASAQGPDTSTVYSEPSAVFSFKTEKPGVIIAVSSCNVHGLWESSKKLKVE